MGFWEFIVAVVTIVAIKEVIVRAIDLEKTKRIAKVERQNEGELSELRQEMADIREMLADTLLEQDYQRQLDSKRHLPPQ
ncbi:MAG: hypothetical protein O3A46_13625 [Candidatus Poribacteria bacterium]|nr:hypothetical protein [Candidatus Poribacteria bacterium]